MELADEGMVVKLGNGLFKLNTKHYYYLISKKLTRGWGRTILVSPYPSTNRLTTEAYDEGIQKLVSHA